jgi:hypothetical protein
VIEPFKLKQLAELISNLELKRAGRLSWTVMQGKVVTEAKASPNKDPHHPHQHQQI